MARIPLKFPRLFIAIMSKEEALTRLKRYCAYRERSHTEVRHKLLELRVFGNMLEEVISDLISENYLNEERYARAYVRGKFKNNKWGRNKILMGLKANKVSNYCIRKGLEEIKEDEYKDVLTFLLQKKLDLSLDLDKYVLIKKLSQYGVQKGYEYDIVNACIKKLIDEKGIV